MKKLLLMLTIAIAMVFASGSVAEAKGEKTITIKKADTSTLSKVDKELKKGKKFYLKVKGSKTGSKNLIKSVSKKIGQTNGYSVRFNYSSQTKSSQGYYRFTVSKDNACLYRDTVKLLADMYTTEVTLSKEVWKPDVIDYTIDANGNYIQVTGAYVIIDVTTTYKKEYDNKPFYKLSTHAQANIIASHFEDPGSKYIKYAGGNYEGCTNRYSDAKIVNKLLKGTMKGVCYDFTNSQLVLFDQIGIEAYYARSVKMNHAMPIVKVKNSRGKVMWICYDYGAGLPYNELKVNKKNFLSYLEASDDWEIKASKKINNEAYNNTWTKDDANCD